MSNIQPYRGQLVPPLPPQAKLVVAIAGKKKWWVIAAIVAVVFIALLFTIWAFSKKDQVVKEAKRELAPPVTAIASASAASTVQTAAPAPAATPNETLEALKVLQGQVKGMDTKMDTKLAEFGDKVAKMEPPAKCVVCEEAMKAEVKAVKQAHVRHQPVAARPVPPAPVAQAQPPAPVAPPPVKVAEAAPQAAVVAPPVFTAGACNNCEPTPVAIDYGHEAPINGMCTITVIKNGNRDQVQARLVVTKHAVTRKILVTRVAEFTKQSPPIGRPLWTPHTSPGTCDGDKALVTKDWAIIVKMLNLPNDCVPANGTKASS